MQAQPVTSASLGQQTKPSPLRKDLIIPGGNIA
jgi:hypothetical protein